MYLILELGIKVIEIGGGGGRMLCTLAEKFPKSKFTLTDITAEPLGQAEETILKKGLTNVNLQLLDILNVSNRLK